MNEEQSYERLLQALQDMKNEIAKQIRPVEEQIIHANREHIRQSFTQESQRLGQCLDEIDNNILACRKAMDEYERIRNGLMGSMMLTSGGLLRCRFPTVCRATIR